MGYARTQFSPLAERRPSDDLVVVSGSGILVKQSGEELRRFGMTYTPRRSNQDWRIVVAVVHDPSGP